MSDEVKKEEKIIVNGNEVAPDKFEEMQKDKNIRLHKESENSYRVLQRLVE
jgi:hypothetical protein